MFFQYITHKPETRLYLINYLWSGMTGVEIGVTPVILSGIILKLKFAVILTFEMVMRKSALKMGIIPQN